MLTSMIIKRNLVSEMIKCSHSIHYNLCTNNILYSHGQELFYKFISNFTNKLVKQLMSMTVELVKQVEVEHKISSFGA